MLKKFFVLLFFAACVFSLCGAEENKAVFLREKQNVLRSGKPFISPSCDSCEVWFPAEKSGDFVFEYSKEGKDGTWQKAEAEFFEENGVSGYKCLISGLPEPKRYSSYSVRARSGGKELFSEKFVKVAQDRLKLINPMKQGELLLRPTFNACGVYFGSPRVKNVVLEFKKSTSDKWEKALAPEYFYEASEDRYMVEYRGSIVKLDEDTSYDVRLLDGEKVLKTGSFKTWASNVPVAKTIVLKQSDFARMPYVISEKGTPDGWIRYTAEKGSVFKSSRSVPMLEVKNAQYILIDDMTFSGGPSKSILTIEKSKAVRVRNCEMSNWGIVGKPRYDQFGRFFTPEMDRKQYGINWNGAIAIYSGSSEVVVERCFIHSPRNHANSWFYSHPAGPQAIMLYKPDHSTVIRYNDFIGSDSHRFNDAVESVGNFETNGGINRDADVYGNFMIYCNDDNIELDGGHQNVRCFWNHFEGALCGVSIQGLMVSPVYVFENIFAGMSEQFGLTGQTIKTTGVLTGDNATAFIFNNTLVRNGSGIDIRERINNIMFNNVFSHDRERIVIRDSSPSPGSVFKANSVGSERQVKAAGIDKIDTKFVNADCGNYLPVNPGKAIQIPNFLPEGGIRGAFQSKDSMVLPYRPVPFKLDRTRVGEVKVAGGTASPAEVKITASVGGNNFKSVFSIRKNPEFDWFEVTPAKGVMKSGSKITFTVKFIPEKMNKSHNYRGAFLIRLPDGLSRPVTVSASTDYVEPFERDVKEDTAIYIDAFKPAKVYDIRKGRARNLKVVDDPMGINGKFVIPVRKNIYEYQVNVPKTGRYYFMLHGKVDGYNSIMAAVNNDKLQMSKQQFKREYTSWTMITPGRSFGNMCRHYDLKKGINTIKISGVDSQNKVLYDGIVLTTNPQYFEPRP